ncbi:glycosyltransferase family 4 protein [Alteromonas gracilis]|uniref:glycosyltransferase family 4 protein n=1 Tax=Alteromonas gracilis TaxID=1479524 RepID=UPI0037368DE5
MSNSVLHIELGTHLHGTAEQVTYLINALEHYDDLSQHLICAEDSDLRHTSFKHCTTHTIKYAGGSDFLCVKRLLEVVNSINPAIIHVHSERGLDVWGAMLAKISGIPTVCTKRADTPETHFSFYKYKQFDAVISISQGVQNVVSLHCEGVKHQCVIYPAVDIKQYSQARNRAWLNKTFSIPDNHFVVANFAQYISQNGQADIILAMHDVLNEHENVTCLLFGEGSLKDSYQSLIERHNLGDHVKLCGFTDDVAKILPNIDILVHPSYSEGLGDILLQAGASKCAVLSTPVGGIPEIIKHKETGVMMAPGDIDGIGESIISLIETPEKRAQYAEALHRYIASKFTIQRMAEAHADLYSTLILEGKEQA